MKQGGVTKILTVGRSATGVKLEVKGQGLQKLSSHRSNKKLHGQETKRKLQPTIKQNEFIKVYGLILDYTVFIITFRLLCMLRPRDV